MLPNFIVIGAMKCGTSSLHYYLSLHPEVFMSTPKELDFFVAERNWDKGLEWYESHFALDKKSNKVKIYGEASTNYTKYPAFKGIPGRIQSLLPDARLIYLIRNPIDRICSHYMHNYYEEIETRPFSEALSSFNDNHYINCSKYYMQLEQYLEYYSMESILVITTEELRKSPLDTMKKVFTFLGINNSFYTEKFTKILHKTTGEGIKNAFGRFLSKVPIGRYVKSFLPSYSLKLYSQIAKRRIDRPVLDKNLKQDLAGYLKDDIDRLMKLTKSDFEYWHF